MDIDGLPPTPSTSRAPASTSTPRPSSTGIKLPGIRTLPGFPIAQPESASGSGLGSSLGRDREWDSVREREAAKDRAALREMEWERQRENEWRERERVKGFESGIGGVMGYSGVRTGLGKERELSLPMPTPVSRPLVMSSSSAMSMTPVDDRPLSRGYTSSATLNSILGVSGPSEPLSYAQPKPVLSASRSLSSPSPFTHGVGGSGLPPIGHGLLAARRKGVGGTSGEMGLGGGLGTTGGIWAAPGQAMSPTLPTRSPSAAASSAGSSSLAHLYAAASASGQYIVSPTVSTSGASAPRPSSSHASSSALGMNGYGYGRSRTDSNASVNTHISASGSLTPTSHHRMPMSMSPPASVSALSHPRPQHSYAAASPPLLPSHQQQQSYRLMSPPAPASTSVMVRGNENPYLAARDAQPLPSSRSPTYMRSPLVEKRRMEPVSPPPRVHVQLSLPPHVEARLVPASPPPVPTDRHEESIAHVRSVGAVGNERDVSVEMGRKPKTRGVVEEPTTKETLRMEVDVDVQGGNEAHRPSSSLRMEISTSSVAVVPASLEAPISSTPNERHDMLRPPSSSPMPHLSPSSPIAEPSASSPPNRVRSSPSAAPTSSSETTSKDHPHSHPHPPPSPAQRPALDVLIPPPETPIPDDSIRCICGISIDDGFSIACDVCSRWCHTACFKIGQESVPEEWVCWVCARSSPNPSGGSNNGNGHTVGAGVAGRGKGRGKGKGTGAGAGAASRQWKPGTKEEVEERRVWARAMQMERLGLVDAPGGGWVRAGLGLEAGGMMAPPVDVPGTTGKRKRRPSAVPPFQQQQPQEGASGSVLVNGGSVPIGVEGGFGAAAGGVAGSTSEVVGEEEDEEPWTSTYVSIAQDVITDPDTRARLRRHAQRWRGVSALVQDGDDGMDLDIDGPTDGSRTQRPVRVETMPDPDTPTVAVRPLAPFARGGNVYGADGAGASSSMSNPNSTATPTLPPSSLNTLASASFAYNPLVLPPSYSLHATSSIPSKALIAPFVSNITPSSTYLADPLNAYVHLGMPKPYVHLLGPPLEVALDARGVGGKARFARRGCWPNAVVRPVLCDNGKVASSKKGKERQRSGGEESEEEDGTQLAFGVFALRDLKAGEEVVLGWEWDDGHVVHKLPALLQTPSLVSPRQVPHIKDQMANLLHALASNFVSCACGAKVQLGEGCTGHHNRGEEQERGRRHREYQDGCYDGTDFDVGNPYNQEAPRGRTRERMSVREKRLRQKEKQQACALASMARFVGRDDRHYALSDSQCRSHDPEVTEEVDLGPLIGSNVARGVRTREGRFGGVENIHGGHGKRQAEKGRRDHEMNWRRHADGWRQYDDIGHEGNANMRGSNNGEYTGSRHTAVVQEPRPPDPPWRHRGKPSKATNASMGDEAKIPPKMRMRQRWSEMHEVSNVHSDSDASVKHPPTASTSEPVGPMDVDDEDVLQVTENRRLGLGITFDRMAIPVVARGPTPPSMASASPTVIIDEGMGPIPATSQALMPPPPLPSPLVSALMPTVSEPTSSSVLDATWSNGVPRSPPRSPGSPIVAPSSSLPRRPSASSDGETQTSGPTPPPPSNPALSVLSQSVPATTALTNSPSPLVSFANLSLLSPAILNQVRMQVQTQNTTSAALQAAPDTPSLPPHSLSSLSTSITSYFPAQVAPLAAVVAIAPTIHAHPESSPSSFSFEQMDINRGASVSPSHATKDDKSWSPLQRRATQSFVRMSQIPRLSASEPSAPSEPAPPPLLAGSPLALPKAPEENFIDEPPSIAPSKFLNKTDTCEAGVRVEYSAPPELSATHASCTEVAQRRSLSPDAVDIRIETPDDNARSRPQTPSALAVTEPTSMEVDADVPHQPEAEPVLAQPEAEREPQSDESDDTDFPSHRWRRKRKRIVSMDSDAGQRSQSPPYKVARDSEMPGVNVHTSPRPQREMNEPLPQEIAVNGDAVMQDSQAERTKQVEQYGRSVTPVDVTVDDSPTTEGHPAIIVAEESDHMTVDETAPLPITEVSHSENTLAFVPSESAVSALPTCTIVSAPEPSPQPEAPRKVKLSLADFARRKKQQRQEEERQLEMQKALNPPPPTTPPPVLHVVVTEPLPMVATKELAEQMLDSGHSVTRPILAPEISSPALQEESLPVVRIAPILNTAVVELTSVNGTSHSSPVPSPMSVSPEETAPPPIKFVLSAPTEKLSSPTPSTVPSPPEPAPPLTGELIELSSPQVNGSTLKSVPLDLPATASTTKAPPAAPTVEPTSQASDAHERQAKQERIEAVIPPPPSSKPSRFGPPLTRPLVGLVVHPPAAKPGAPSSAPGGFASPDRRSPAPSYVHERIPLPPHARRQSQTQEDGEIRENVPPVSPAPALQPSKPTWFGRPLPDPPQDAKDLKGWNQYYREVYNLTGSFDPPGVAVRPGMHPPPKGPRSLNLKGEVVSNMNGGSAGQPVPSVPGAPSRSSLPIPTGPRLGVRSGARGPILDDATRAALAKAKTDVAPPVLVSASVPVHLQSQPVTLGPPPLSARIGPPVPRGSSVDYGERDRDEGDRRGGRDYRPYARGRGRGGGGVWRK